MAKFHSMKRGCHREKKILAYRIHIYKYEFFFLRKLKIVLALSIVLLKCSFLNKDFEEGIFFI